MQRLQTHIHRLNLQTQAQSDETIDKPLVAVKAAPVRALKKAGGLVMMSLPSINDQAVFSNNSRPISIRRISLVPAPIS
jgi:hypothetical protein